MMPGRCCPGVSNSRSVCMCLWGGKAPRDRCSHLPRAPRWCAEPLAGRSLPAAGAATQNGEKSLSSYLLQPYNLPIFTSTWLSTQIICTPYLYTLNFPCAYTCSSLGTLIHELTRPTNGQSLLRAQSWLDAEPKQRSCTMLTWQLGLRLELACNWSAFTSSSRVSDSLSTSV